MNVSSCLKSEAEFRVGLNPTRKKVTLIRRKDYDSRRRAYLIAYPPQLAPAATALSGSICKKTLFDCERIDLRTFYLRMLVQRILPAIYHIDERLSSPVLRDSISKFCQTHS